MSWRISFVVLAILCISGFTSVKCSRDSDLGNGGAGSGGWSFSDDEDLMDSGSGSGSGMGEIDTDVEKTMTTQTTTTTTTVKISRTTDHPLTDCENMRQSSQSLLGKYAPRCLPNGDFDSLQCHGYPGTAECWCSDLQGREVPGTLMEAPNYPSCDDGNNLPPCVYQLVKHSRSNLLGSFRPKCAVDGQFDLVQCRGSMCFCVDESTGNQVSGTEVNHPDKPKCDDDSAGVDEPDVTTKELMPENAEGNIVIDEGDESQNPTPEVDVETNVDSDDAGSDDDMSEETRKGDDKFGDDNKTRKDDQETVLKSGQDGLHEDKVEKASEIMTQPGILAGIIGGSVVLLLCLVLLIMFVIYRMRKKDEGSYPLDEPRKTPNYNYVRAPEKEFYA